MPVSKRRTTRTPLPCLARNRLRHVALTLLVLLFAPVAWAQSAAPESLPPWTVLVLKLVSATHVQPTTGIVIGSPGLVLVAADFAREGDEIMVLDGGTDIVRHGRPAHIVQTLPADKLAVLQVQGLNRPATTLSAVSPASLQSLSLVGFPPAEMIAQGAAPVRASVKTLAAITTAHPTLEPFPNVAGALNDDCGNLVAFHLASGVQSMQPSNSPRLAWGDAIQRAAQEAGASLQQAECNATPTQAKTETPAEEKAEEKSAPPPPLTAPEDEPEAQPEAAEPLQEEDPPETTEPEIAEDPAEELPADEDLETGALEELPEDVLLGEGDSNESGNAQVQTRKVSATALIIAVLLVLLLLGWWLNRRFRKSSTGSAAAAPDVPDEPGTMRFDVEANRPPAVVLQVKATLPEGEEFSQQLPVSSPEWMAEFGRQDADIIINCASVSRRHAKIRLHEGRLVLSDLDSTNGTRVNGIPCLPGEEFFVLADDQVQLGEVTLSLQLSSGEETD